MKLSLNETSCICNRYYMCTMYYLLNALICSSNVRSQLSIGPCIGFIGNLKHLNEQFLCTLKHLNETVLVYFEASK